MPKGYRRKSAGKKALAEIKKIKRDFRPELKMTYESGSFNASSDFVSSVVYDMQDNMARGTGHSQFLGDDVKAKSLLIRGIVEWTSESPKAVVRLMVFKKIDDTNITPVAMSAAANEASVLGYNALATYVPLMPLDWHNRDKWKVLWDELLVGNPDSVDKMAFKKYVKLNHKIQFNNAAEVQKGGIYIMGVSDIPNASNPPVVTFRARLKYTDA